MNNILQLIGAAFVGAIITFIVMKIITKPEIITTSIPVVERVYKDTCLQRTVDSLLIYEQIRLKKRSNKPIVQEKDTPVISEPVVDVSDNLYFERYEYQDVNLHVIENLILSDSACIQEFNREIYLDTPYVYVTVEIPSDPIYITSPQPQVTEVKTRGVLFGVDLSYPFEYGVGVGYKTRNDMIYLLSTGTSNPFNNVQPTNNYYIRASVYGRIKRNK
jgi:hypothetical protein